MSPTADLPAERQRRRRRGWRHLLQQATSHADHGELEDIERLVRLRALGLVSESDAHHDLFSLVKRQRARRSS